MTRIRFTKDEKAQRAAAQRTLADPNASASATYHARLLLKQTEEDATARAEKKPDQPVLIHRKEIPPDPVVRKFLDEVGRMLEEQAADVEAITAESPAASVTPRVPEPALPSSDEICTLCLISRENCGHINPKHEVKPNE